MRCQPKVHRHPSVLCSSRHLQVAYRHFVASQFANLMSVLAKPTSSQFYKGGDKNKESFASAQRLATQLRDVKIVVSFASELYRLATLEPGSAFSHKLTRDKLPIRIACNLVRCHRYRLCYCYYCRRAVTSDLSTFLKSNATRQKFSTRAWD